MIWPTRRRARHVSEHVLLALLRDDGLAVREREAASAHVQACGTCADRHARLAAFLQNVDAAASAAADEAFPPERLAAQRQRIMRRLERLLGREGPARVIPFPAVARGLPRRVPGAQRWIAAAAAAGLLVGVGAGRYADLRRTAETLTVERPAAPAIAQPTGAPTIARAGSAADVLAEETFLLEVEAALGALQVAELQALDQLTPRVRDIAVNIR